MDLIVCVCLPAIATAMTLICCQLDGVARAVRRRLDAMASESPPRFSASDAARLWELQEQYLRGRDSNAPGWAGAIRAHAMLAYGLCPEDVARLFPEGK